MSGISDEELKVQAHRLMGFLVDLKQGLIDVIEYGIEAAPGGYHSYLRIRYIPTQGGLQFCLRSLTASGGESSGVYDPEACGIGLLATRRVIELWQPRHLGGNAVQRPQNLTWFAFKEGEQRRLDVSTDGEVRDYLGGDGVAIFTLS